MVGLAGGAEGGLGAPKKVPGWAPLVYGVTQRSSHDLPAGARDSGLETHNPCALLRAPSSLQPRVARGWVTERLLGARPCAQSSLPPSGQAGVP